MDTIKTHITNEEFDALIIEIGEFFSDFAVFGLPRKIVKGRSLHKQDIEDIVNGWKCHLDIEYKLTIQPAQIRMMFARVQRKLSQRKPCQGFPEKDSANITIHEGPLARKNDTKNNRRPG